MAAQKKKKRKEKTKKETNIIKIHISIKGQHKVKGESSSIIEAEEKGIPEARDSRSSDRDSELLGLYILPFHLQIKLLLQENNCVSLTAAQASHLTPIMDFLFGKHSVMEGT